MRVPSGYRTRNHKIRKCTAEFNPEECETCGYTMKISSRYHRLLIYNKKRTTTIDGMGPFKTR